MKIVKTASGKKTVKMSKKEWTAIGKKAGWMKLSQNEKKILDVLYSAFQLEVRNGDGTLFLFTPFLSDNQIDTLNPNSKELQLARRKNQAIIHAVESLNQYHGTLIDPDSGFKFLSPNWLSFQTALSTAKQVEPLLAKGNLTPEEKEQLKGFMRTMKDNELQASKDVVNLYNIIQKTPMNERWEQQK